MTNQILTVVEREYLNLNNFSVLDNNLLVFSIRNDLKTNLKDILFYLFQHKLKSKSKCESFNKLYSESQNLLDNQINRLGHLNKDELIVWYSSVFMCLMSFKNSVESKYTLDNSDDIIKLLKEIFETSLYKFIDYNSKKFSLKSKVTERLCDEQITKEFKYYIKKSQSRITIDSESNINGIKSSERNFDYIYPTKKVDTEEEL